MTRARVRTGLGVALLCIAPALAVVTGVAPASAAVQSVTPASATVTAGGAASATVRVDAAGVVCLEVSQPHPTIRASVDNQCDAGSWSTGLTVRSSGDTPAGNYPVTVSDGESSRTFTLRVQAPPAPTTTTVRPTTTAPRPTTTAPRPSTTPPTEPPTTLAPTTAPTTAPASTTTPTTAPLGPGELRGEPFASADVLVDAGIPEEGMFIPLTYEAFTDCLPLKGPCADLASPLVLAPARAYDIRWSAAEGASTSALPELLATRGLESLQVVGTEPDLAATATFTLAALDLASGETGEVRSFESHLDAERRLVPGAGSGDGGGSPLSATLEPPVTAIDRATSRPPFGRPYRVSTRRLTEAAPVLVAYGSTTPQLLYALRTPDDWGLGQHSLPLLGSGRVPYLARNVDGPPGLVVPIPAAIAGQLGPERSAPPGDADDDTDGSGGARSSDGPLVLAAALVAAALAFVALRFWRRRRAAGLR